MTERLAPVFRHSDATATCPGPRVIVMRYVEVSDKGGRLLVIYPISLASMSHAPTDTEYFEAARQLAVEDQLVTLMELGTLRMTFVGRPSIRTRLETG